MLPVANQFHDLFECLSVIGHKNISICRAAFVLFLYEGVYLCPVAPQGLSRKFLNTFAAIIPDPIDRPGSPRIRLAIHCDI